VLGLYRGRYFDLNVRHFHETLLEEHGIGLSYTWVKQALQGAGLVKRGRKRGVHRKRRERRSLPGMLLHIRAQLEQRRRWRRRIRRRRRRWLVICPTGSTVSTSGLRIARAVGRREEKEVASIHNQYLHGGLPRASISARFSGTGNGAHAVIFHHSS
jgi:hypothetical protein